jgi:hypothetical protein
MLNSSHLSHGVKTQEGNRCCKCGKVLNYASGPRQPVPGDISVCIECGTVMQFSDHLFLEKMDPEDVERLPAEFLSQIREFQRLLAEIRQGIKAPADPMQAYKAGAQMGERLKKFFGRKP